VYSLRDAQTGQILKYGKSFCLRTRIFGNYIGGHEGRQRIHKKLIYDHMIDRVELAWLETKDDDEACRKEIEFRGDYTRTNGKRPPWELNG
jgi:hypothetical protein